MKEFTGVRSDLPEWERLAVQVGRGVLCRFDRAVRSFYKRCKKGQNPGFPRFKSSRRWRTIEIPDVSPSMVVPPGTEGASFCVVETPGKGTSPPEVQRQG